MIEQIASKTASVGVGPYSQAVKANGFVFVSGQLGIDLEIGSIVSGGAEAEMHQALKNIDHILSAAGSSWHKVVKVKFSSPPNVELGHVLGEKS
jgi:2-iminobutanoate/2-iminopropanoate deaminase